MVNYVYRINEGHCGIVFLSDQFFFSCCEWIEVFIPWIELKTSLSGICFSLHRTPKSVFVLGRNECSSKQVNGLALKSKLPQNSKRRWLQLLNQLPVTESISALRWIIPIGICHNYSIKYFKVSYEFWAHYLQADPREGHRYLQFTRLIPV